MGNIIKSWKQGGSGGGCATCGKSATPAIVTKGTKVIKKEAKIQIDPETGLLDITPDIETEIPFGVMTLDEAENEDLETIEPPKKGRRKVRR